MSTNNINSCYELAEKLKLKEVVVKKTPFDDAFQYVLFTLRESLIDYLEWDVENACVYVSDYFFDYSGIHTTNQISLWELLDQMLDTENMLLVLNAFKALCDGTQSNQTVELSAYSHILDKVVLNKINLFRIEKTNHKGFIITGITQDISLFQDALNALNNSKLLFKELLNAMPFPILFVNPSNQIEYANRPFDAILDIEHSKIVQMLFDDYMEVLKNKYPKVNLEVLTEKNQMPSYKLTIVKNGEKLEFIIDEIDVINAANEEIGKLYVHTDITNQINDVEKVKKMLKVNELLVKIEGLINERTSTHALYKAILNGIIEIIPSSSRGCILLLDYENNLYVKESVGYDDDYVKTFRIPFNKSFAFAYMDGNYRKSVCIDNIQDLFGDNFPDIKSAKRGFILESNIAAPININGKLFGLISIDCSEKSGFDDLDLNLIDFMRNKIELSLNRYVELSNFIEETQKDELTGLYTRKYFVNAFKTYVDEAVLSHTPFYIVLMDLDDLKKVNDSYGHNFGDQMIRHFSKTVSEHIRKADVFARLGGDEFIGVFKNSDETALRHKFEEIRAFLDQSPITCDKDNIKVQFSFGIASFPEHGDSLEDLISLADELMYKQKMTKK